MYKRQLKHEPDLTNWKTFLGRFKNPVHETTIGLVGKYVDCLLYTSDAADERSSVDLGGRRIIKNKTKDGNVEGRGLVNIT